MRAGAVEDFMAVIDGFGFCSRRVGNRDGRARGGLGENNRARRGIQRGVSDPRLRGRAQLDRGIGRQPVPRRDLADDRGERGQLRIDLIAQFLRSFGEADRHRPQQTLAIGGLYGVAVVIFGLVEPAGHRAPDEGDIDLALIQRLHAVLGRKHGHLLNFVAHRQQVLRRGLILHRDPEPSRSSMLATLRPFAVTSA